MTVAKEFESAVKAAAKRTVFCLMDQACNAGLESAAVTCEKMVVGGRAWTAEQEAAANALLAAAKHIRSLKTRIPE